MGHNSLGRAKILTDTETATNAAASTGITVASHTVARRVAFVYNGVGGASVVHAQFLGNDASNNFPGPFTNWWNTSNDLAAKVTASFEAGWTGGNITIHGQLWDGTVDSEILAANPGGVTNGTKWFRTITAAEKGAVGAAKWVSLDVAGGPTIVVIGAVYDTPYIDDAISPHLANVPGVGVSLDCDAAGLGGGDPIMFPMNFSVPNTVTDTGHTHTQYEHTHLVVDEGHVHNAPTFDLLSVKFDGVDDYVDCGDNLGFDATTEAFTVPFYIKTTQKTGGTIISKMTAASKGWDIVLDDGHMKFRCIHTVGTNGYIDSLDTDIMDGRWHHVVWVWSAGASCYVDGILASVTNEQNNLSTANTNTEHLVIGAGAGGASGFFRGCLDEIAIYDEEKDSTEAAWIYNGSSSPYSPANLKASGAPSGLVGYWRMGDGDTYPTLLDISGKIGNPYPTIVDAVGTYDGTITLMNASAIVASTLGGVSTFAVRTINVGDLDNCRVVVGNVYNFASTDKFAFSFWNRGADRTMAFRKMNTSWPFHGFQIDGGSGYGLNCTLRDSNNVSINRSLGGYGTGAWFHVVLSYDGAGTSKIYVNGLLVATDSAAFTGSFSNNGTLTLCQGTYSGGWWKEHDEMAIYTDELTLSDVAWIYNGGVPRDLLGAGAPKTPASWWKMGDDGVPLAGYDGTMMGMVATSIQGDVPWKR